MPHFLAYSSTIREMKRRSGFGFQTQKRTGCLKFPSAVPSTPWSMKKSRRAGSTKASGTTHGVRWLTDFGNMRNRSSLSRNRRQIRKRNLSPPHFTSACPQTSGNRDRDGPRATKRNERLRTDEPCVSVTEKHPVPIISSSFKYPKSGNESSTNQGVRMAAAIPTSIQGLMRMSRIPGGSVAFGIENGVYYPGCRGSMKSLFRR